jgi:HEAT repeat protein
MLTIALLILPMSNDDVSELMVDLAAQEPFQRARAAEYLARLGPEARDAAVPLVRACGDPSEDVRQWAGAALEEMGPPDASDVQALATLLSHPHADVGYWAATLLGRMGGEAANAVPALTAALSADAPMSVRQRSAWALGRIGPPARSALDSLRQAASEADRRLARLAVQAIGQIEG